MNQNLFHKIVGKRFQPTNFKVESLNDLKAVIEKQEENLNLRVFNENAECYELKSSEISPDNNGILELIVSIALGDLYSYGLNHLDSYKKEILAKLTFKINKEDKLNFFKDEFLRIENLFLTNPYFELLTPDNYFNEINSREFITNLWNSLKKNNFKAFSKWKEKQPKNIEEILYTNEENGESIHSLFIYLGEFTTLKLIFNDFCQQEGRHQSAPPKIIPYPILFKSVEAFHLFNYIIAHFPEKKHSRAFLSRYYYLFVEEDLIERGAPWKEFFKFLDKEHKITLSKIDDRAQPNSKDEKDFQKFKSNFALSKS